MNNPTNMSPALASIYDMNAGAPRTAGLSSGMNGQQTFIPSYQMGGMVGPGGMPEPMGMPPGMPPGMPAAPGGAGLAPQNAGPMPPEMMQMQVSQFTNQHPEQVAQIQASIQELLASGEISPQELNMITQLATVAAQNPEMYPYVRNFAIQQGIATEQDLPAEYDQGLVFVLLVAAQAAQQSEGGQPIPSMARGGMTPESKKADGSVIINAHEGEYVIPANVVRMKGKEFFDSLVEKYKA